jgi:glyoxylase-like metal-dependent hydrolase (beta-lactamase superfamily II)
MELLKNLHAFIWMDPNENNCNTYLISGEKNILVDPGHAHLFGSVNDELQKLSMTPADIDVVLVTHAHPDHMEGISLFADLPGKIGLSEEEMVFIEHMAPHYGKTLGMSKLAPHMFLKEGQLRIGRHLFEILHTPGHSPGSICIYWPKKKVLFTGDVVFNQGIGRTDLPGGSGEQLKSSIRRLAQLDVAYLLTGHGDPVTDRNLVLDNFKQIEDMWFPYL